MTQQVVSASEYSDWICMPGSMYSGLKHHTLCTNEIHEHNCSDPLPQKKQKYIK